MRQKMTKFTPELTASPPHIHRGNPESHILEVDA